MPPQEDSSSPSGSGTILTAEPPTGWATGLGWGLGLGKGCACYAKGTARFILCWCWLVHTAATSKLLQPALRPLTATVKQPRKDNAGLKRRCSKNPAGRSRAMHRYHQLLHVNAKHTTLWLTLCVGKSYLPYQVRRGLERFLTVLHEPWWIRKSGPVPKNTFKFVSPYRSYRTGILFPASQELYKNKSSQICRTLCWH